MIKTGLEMMMAPPWRSMGMRCEEPLLFVRDKASSVGRARTLFRPKRILSLGRANGAFCEIGDFRLDGRNVFSASALSVSVQELYPAPSSPSSPRHRDGDRSLRFAEGHDFHDLQMVADYETAEEWAGPVPKNQSAQLPHLQHRIAKNLPVRLAVLGDSITSGANASGITGARPFQPAYGPLFAARLRARSGGEVRLGKFAKGGGNSAWGLQQVSAVISADPHLVVIAFGMNDASEKVPVEIFRRHVKQIISNLEAAVPGVEFVLISGMTPNPEWDLFHADLRQSYHEALQALAREHVAFCDVRSSWEYLVEQKGFWSLTGNGVNHPNDFGHRFYADCLAETVLPFGNEGRAVESHGFGVR